MVKLKANQAAVELGKLSWERRKSALTPDELREQQQRASLAAVLKRWMRRKNEERQNNG